MDKEDIDEDDLYYLTHFSKMIAENVRDYNVFAIKWREHFIKTMKPQHMPEAWKVDRKVDLSQVWVPERMIRDHARKSP
jgi:hypothetical protein